MRFRTFMSLSMAGSVCLFGAGCGDQPPLAPSAAPAKSSTGGDLPGSGASGLVRATVNAPPIVNWKTVPRADLKATPYPTVSGVIPLTVRFNLCPSDDPDTVHLPDGSTTGDSINWQFNFGDLNSMKPAFLPSGQFNPDFEHFCRVEHTYEREGRFTATLSVTDKHVEDQARNVTSLARTTVFVTINAGGVEPPPSAGGPCAIQFFTFNDSDTAIWSWSVTGSVAGVTLRRPDNSTITGLPASQVNFNTGPRQCGPYRLIAVCTNGATDQETETITTCSSNP